MTLAVACLSSRWRFYIDAESVASMRRSVLQAKRIDELLRGFYLLQCHFLRQREVQPNVEVTVLSTGLIAKVRHAQSLLEIDAGFDLYRNTLACWRSYCNPAAEQCLGQVDLHVNVCVAAKTLEEGIVGWLRFGRHLFAPGGSLFGVASAK